MKQGCTCEYLTTKTIKTIWSLCFKYQGGVNGNFYLLLLFYYYDNTEFITWIDKNYKLKSLRVKDLLETIFIAKSRILKILLYILCVYYLIDRNDIKP